MGRASVKENKNIYQQTREKLGLTREQASMEMEVSSSRLERIENEKIIPEPKDIIEMATRYKAPHLCNYYCANECMIGYKYVPQVDEKQLSEIVIKMLASLNSIESKKDRFVEISADGTIDTAELDDFIMMSEELERISSTATALKLWLDEMFASKKISRNEYNARKKMLLKK